MPETHDKPMSFLPEDYIERRVERRTNIVCLTLFAVVLIGTVAAYLVTVAQRSQIKTQRRQINQQYAEAAQHLEQLEKLQRQKQQMLHKAQVTASLIEPAPRTFILADLINRMPTTLSLLEMQLDTRLIKPRISVKTKADKRKRSKLKNATAAAATAPPLPRRSVRLVLVGVAPTDVQVAQYMASLAQSPLLRDVTLIYSEESRVSNLTMRRFRVEMTLNPLADVRRIDPLRMPRKIKSDPMRTPTITDHVPQISSGDTTRGWFGRLGQTGVRKGH